MKRLFKYSFVIVVSLLVFVSCAILRAPKTIINEPIKEYKYIYIKQTESLTSGYGNMFVSNGYHESKSVNPQDVISGILMKEGFIVLTNLEDDLIDETLIVNYGESGKRQSGFGYTIEVTIQFVSAKTHKLVGTTTAEGQGSMEADDIREAITRALNAILTENTK